MLTWENLSDLLSWANLGRLSDIISIALFLPMIFSSLVLLLIQRRRQKKILENIKSRPGNRPIALAISIGKVNIINQVLAHLETEGEKMELESLYLTHLSAEQTQDFVYTLRETRAKLLEKGADVIHLFYMGPVAGALLVGDVFSNGAVRIYYHDRTTGHYENWGFLTYPMT